MNNLIRRVLCIPLIPFCIREVKGVVGSDGYILDFAYGSYRGLIRPMQSRYEVTALFGALREARPKVIVEIGAGNGGNLFLFSRLPSAKHLVSIDNHYYPWERPLFKSFALPNSRINLIEGDSHSNGTLLKLKETLGGKKIDFLFIDGEHSYKASKKDFEMYSPLVRKGGIIAFHDINLFLGINKCWNEVKGKNFREIIDESTELGIGLTVV